MNDPHMSNVSAFIGFFVIAALFTMFCIQIGNLMKSKRTIKANQFRAGGVITNKIPNPVNPPMPLWANKLMENRKTGEVLPVLSDETGFWHFRKGQDPINLPLSEWSIKSD